MNDKINLINKNTEQTFFRTCKKVKKKTKDTCYIRANYTE